MTMRTMDGIRSVLQLKDDKAEVPDVYLGATLSQVETKTGTKCWSMFLEKYIKAAIDNLESKPRKSDMHLPKCRTTMLTSYHPMEDVTKDLNAESIQFYQELIGILRWAVEIGRVDILLEVSLFSSHLAFPRFGHLQAVYHKFGYLKQIPNRKLYFDPVSPLIRK